MKSLLGGMASFRLATFLSVLIIPVVSFFRPIFGVGSSITLMFQAVGTINLDYRSLYLHFEDGVWIYRNRVIQDIKDDFIQTMEYCRQIEPEFCLNRNIGLRIMQNIFRAFAPLM